MPTNTLLSDLVAKASEIIGNEFYEKPAVGLPFARLAALAASAYQSIADPDGLRRAFEFTAARAPQMPVPMQVTGMLMGAARPSPISALVREIFAFTTQRVTPGSMNVKIPAPTRITGTATLASRTLSENTDVSGVQAMTGSQISIDLVEVGGPYNDSASAVTPIGIRHLARRADGMDQLMLAGRNLQYDRCRMLETVIQDILLATTNVTICTGGTGGGSTLNTMVAGGNLPTDEDLRYVKEKLINRGTDEFSDGFHIIVVPAEFDRLIHRDSRFVDIVSRGQMNLPNYVPDGYIASYAGFHFLRDPSMQTTSGTLAATVYQALALGPKSLGWVPDLAAETRLGDSTDYGRKLSAMWLAIEGWKLVDTNRVEKVLFC